jgi:uncharacterized protein (TIGR02145 family)
MIFQRSLTVLILAALSLASSPGTASEKEERSDFTDPRDGQSYPTVTIGGMTWLARNLNFASRESYCYDDDKKNCARNGRLYRWEAALAACPEGWHLSTEFEWQALELAIGMPFKELQYRADRGSQEGGRLKRDGDLGFGVQFAGWRGYEKGGQFRHQEEATALWTATEADLNHAWHRHVDTNDDTIWRSRVVKTYAISLRCVQNRSEYDVLEENP